MRSDCVAGSAPRASGVSFSRTLDAQQGMGQACGSHTPVPQPAMAAKLAHSWQLVAMPIIDKV